MVNKISDDDRGAGMVFSQSEFKNLLDTDFADGTDFFCFSRRIPWSPYLNEKPMRGAG